MIKNFVIIPFILATLGAQAADSNAAEAAKARVKANIKSYFADSTYRCHDLRGYDPASREQLNAVAAKIRAFYDKAVAVHYRNGEVQAADQNEYVALADEGRALELEFRGKIGDQWFKNGLVEKLFSEEIEYPQQGVDFLCSLEVMRGMALVSPARLPKDQRDRLAPEAYYTVAGEKYVKPDATKYAAIVADWTGEAELSDFIDSQGIRGMNIGGYFKDTWFFGIARALRYKKANGSYGFDAYVGKVESAKTSYKSNAGNPNFGDEEKTAAVKYLERNNDLIKAGNDYLNSL